MNKQGHITAIGLGPGDAELVTIKGYKVLKSADVIFYPASVADGEKITSFSFNILDQLELNALVEPLHIPMNARNREQHYMEAYQKVRNAYDHGSNVVIVSEGDVLFYSTFGYLWKYILKDRLSHSLIPGIPAFVAASSQGNIPLVDGNTGLRVIPCPKCFDKLREEINDASVLVIMKLSKLKNWDGFFATLDRPFLYAERVGTVHQFVTDDPEQLIARRIPYFSTLIIYSKE